MILAIFFWVFGLDFRELVRILEDDLNNSVLSIRFRFWEIILAIRFWIFISDFRKSVQILGDDLSNLVLGIRFGFQEVGGLNP